VHMGNFAPDGKHTIHLIPTIVLFSVCRFFRTNQIMIDKISITLNDVGQFVINIGDVNYVITDNMKDLLLTIADSSKKLAYFPTLQKDFSTKPITYEEFIKTKNKKQNGNTHRNN